MCIGEFVCNDKQERTFDKFDEILCMTECSTFSNCWNAPLLNHASVSLLIHSFIHAWVLFSVKHNFKIFVFQLTTMMETTAWNIEPSWCLFFAWHCFPLFFACTWTFYQSQRLSAFYKDFFLKILMNAMQQRCLSIWCKFKKRKRKQTWLCETRSTLALTSFAFMDMIHSMHPFPPQTSNIMMQQSLLSET